MFSTPLPVSIICQSHHQCGHQREGTADQRRVMTTALPYGMAHRLSWWHRKAGRSAAAVACGVPLSRRLFFPLLGKQPVALLFSISGPPRICQPNRTAMKATQEANCGYQFITDLFIGRDSSRCCAHRRSAPIGVGLVIARTDWRDRSKRALPMDGSAGYVLAHTTIHARPCSLNASFAYCEIGWQMSAPRP